MFKEIVHNNKILALVIKNEYTVPGINFFTPNDFSQQLAFMKHPEGKIIEPHVHNSVQRQVHFTKEVLFIRKGKIRVDFYTHEQIYVLSVILKTGDVILLSEGGHGFEILEETEMIEVKQGPYAGELDKTRFNPISTDLLNIE